jgi:hypothetical protein
VRTADYFGPDRRRRDDPNFTGPWRRSTDPAARTSASGGASGGDAGWGRSDRRIP